MRIVIKIGTSTLAHPTGHLNIRRVEQLCKIMSDIKNAGHELILVSSGAIGMGVGKLGLRERPKDIPSKQAAAAVGQCELMYTYDKLFSEYHHTVYLYNPSREKKIRVYRVGSSDDDVSLFVKVDNEMGAHRAPV